MNGEAKQPLIPSILYTEGSEKVQCEAQEDLRVPDPLPEVAAAAIAAAVSDEDDTCTSEGE